MPYSLPAKSRRPSGLAMPLKPTASPTTAARIKATDPSSRLAGRLSRITSITGSWLVRELPRSPLNNCQR